MRQLDGHFCLNGLQKPHFVTLVSEPSYRLAMFNTGAIGV